MFNEDLEEVKNRQTEMNNTLEAISNRIIEAEWISNLEDRMVEITAEKQNIEKRMKKKKTTKQTKKKNEDSLRDLWNNIKHTNIHIIGFPEEDRLKGPEKIFEEIIAESSSNVRKEIVNQVQEAHRVPGRINPRRNTPGHIIMKLTKIKDR